MTKVSLAQWQQHLEAAEQADLSLAAYARQHTLSVQSLYEARKALRKRGVTAPPALTASGVSDRFVGIRVNASSSASGPGAVEVRVSERVFLRCAQLPDPVWLASLVRALEQRP